MIEKLDVSNMKLAPRGKLFEAARMFQKGTQFLGASVLLENRIGYDDVVLHLLGQGIEIVQKGLLLAQNFSENEPILKRLGHDLVKGSDHFCDSYGFKCISGSARDELCRLNDLFRAHELRYSSKLDLFGGKPREAFPLVYRRGLTLCRFGNRVFSKSFK